jgi:hypothetical protein
MMKKNFQGFEHNITAAAAATQATAAARII